MNFRTNNLYECLENVFTSDFDLVTDQIGEINL